MIIRESAGLFPVFRASGESTTRTQPGWIPDGRSGTTLDDKCICIGRRRGWVVIQRNRIGRLSGTSLRDSTEWLWFPEPNWSGIIRFQDSHPDCVRDQPALECESQVVVGFIYREPVGCEVMKEEFPL